MKVMVTAQVRYTCWLDEEQTKEVMEYAKENDCEIESAVMDLYNIHSDFDLYHDSTESDFSTESVDEYELESSEEHELYAEIIGE
jgi:hypothetical protein